MSKPRVVTLGCRLNLYESAAASALAADAGLRADDAVIVNTCAVTNEAVRQARQTIRRERRERPDAKIIVTGCAAQIDPAAFSAMDEVDAVLGNQEKLSAAAWGALSTDLAVGAEPVRVNDIFAIEETAGHLLTAPTRVAEGALEQDRARAFVQVQNGCDHRCTFCIIPYGRGNSRSTPMGAVVNEVRALVEAGYGEVVLTGVDLTSYGADLPGAPRLGKLVSKILNLVPGLVRLRLSSIDVAEIDEELFERITQDARIAPHLHLSLQAGDDMVLKRMKRRHTRAEAIDFCARVRTIRPEIAIGADLIAGFPTETEEMHQNSVRLVEECAIAHLHVFPYSAREGTPAARMPQVPGNVAKARAAALRAAGASALSALLETHVGKSARVLVERGGRGRLDDFCETTLPEDCDVPAGAFIELDFSGHAGGRLIAAPLTGPLPIPEAQ